MAPIWSLGLSIRSLSLSLFSHFLRFYHSPATHRQDRRRRWRRWRASGSRRRRPRSRRPSPGHCRRRRRHRRRRRRAGDAAQPRQPSARLPRRPRRRPSPGRSGPAGCHLQRRHHARKRDHGRLVSTRGHASNGGVQSGTPGSWANITTGPAITGRSRCAHRPTPLPARWVPLGRFLSASNLSEAATPETSSVRKSWRCARQRLRGAACAGPDPCFASARR